MINFILNDLLAYKVEIPLIWLISLLVTVFKLGYQVSKRKCFQNNTETSPFSNIVPYSKAQKTSQLEVQEKELSKSSQVSLKRADSQVSEPNIQRKQVGEHIISGLLKQKIELQSKKLQTTSFLQIRVQPSNDSKYMRKIQKHQLVTDYELQAQQEQSSLVPFKNNPNAILSGSNSCLTLIAREDHTKKLISPLVEQKFVTMNYFGDFMKNKEIKSWLTETGRFHKFYRKVYVIGRGGFGSVFRAQNIYDQKQYAIKKIIIDGSVKLNQMLQQVGIISRYNHPKIVVYYTCWIQLANLDEINQFSSYFSSKMLQKQSKASNIQSLNYVSETSAFQFESIKRNKINSRSTKNKNSQLAVIKPTQPNINLVNFYTLHIQMELCHGSLYEYLRNRKSVNYAQSFHILEQLLLGIQFLHSNRIVHRDLKPANILMNKHKNEIKIGDFGLATLIQSHSQHAVRNKVGTPLYMAPQLNSTVAVAKQNMHLVDIFSLGVIYYELLNQFSECTQHERHEKIHSLQSNSVSFSTKQLKEERKFIKLLTKTANLRPSIFEVLQSSQLAILKKKYEI